MNFGDSYATCSGRRYEKPSLRLLRQVHLRDEEPHVLPDVAAEHRRRAGRNPVAVLAQPGFEPVALLAERIRMSYSPTVYCASIVTPRLRARALVCADAAAMSAPQRRWRHAGRIARSHGFVVEVLDQPRRRVGVEVIDSALSPTWICSRCRNVGTGMTTANSFGSPLKSFAIVITVRSPSRTSTTCDALLNSFVSAFAT